LIDQAKLDADRIREDAMQDAEELKISMKGEKDMVPTRRSGAQVTTAGGPETYDAEDQVEEILSFLALVKPDF